MSDEKKVSAEMTEGQEAVGPAPKKKHWPIVLSAFFVVVIAVLVAFLHWHEQPTFCSTMCHATMQTYVDGYYSEDDSLLVSKHAEADVTCLGCHWTQAKMLDLVHEVVLFVSDSFTDPLPDQSQFVSDAFCSETCHDGVTAPTKESATEGWAYDPHNIPSSDEVSMHGEVSLECGDCHKVHKQSVMVCSACHDDATVPDGWATSTIQAKEDVAAYYGDFDPHTSSYYPGDVAMHQTAGSDGGTITCNDCHETKTLVCAECHEGVYDGYVPEGWTLGVNETKESTAETFGVFDPHNYPTTVSMHMTAGSDGGAISCDDCHATQTIVCAQCHANAYTEENIPDGWSVPEGSMDLLAMMSGSSDEEESEEATESSDAVTAEGVADGTYTGEGKGIGGTFEVTVTVKDGKITAVEVGDNSETQGIGSNAIDQLPAKIVEANGLEGVDAVSGASVTSKAIFTAVTDALNQGR